MAEGMSLIEIGKIIKPHGIRGEVKVIPFTDRPEQFIEISSLYVEREEEEGEWIAVERARIQNRFVLLLLEGIKSIEDAEQLRGSLLKVYESSFSPLPKGSHYIFEIVGLKVKTTGGELIGSVVDVMKMPASDVYVVDTGEKEVLIPAIKYFVKKIDTGAGEITIEPIEGLLD